MNKAVLISIRPEWCEKIARGEKTIELRKTRPKLETPFKCYIYQTKQRLINGPTYSDGKVIGEFVCDGILRHCEMANADIAEIQGRVRRKDILGYSNGKEVFGWHISNLVIYGKPKELSDFKQCWTCCYMGVCNDKCWSPLQRPPQSWCYIEEVEP